MTEITELGYVRFGVSDLAEWRTFATELIGLEAGHSEDGKLFLRSDSWHHRIILEEDGTDDIIGIGLRVAGSEEFKDMQSLLADNSIPFEVANEQLAHDRRVLELLTLTDPAGHPLEIFHGPQVDIQRPFHPGRAMYGKFVTGNGGVGHLLLSHQGLTAQYDFYRLLGMRGGIEYRIPMPDGNPLDILFMHCNSRDHTFAFGLPSKTRINHLMLEVDNLDDLYLTYEKVQEHYPIAISPGKHSNDHMFSFYCVTPSGFQIEIGWGGRPATHQSEYYTGDIYGHKFVAGQREGE